MQYSISVLRTRLPPNNWNVVQYSALMHMLAQVSGLKVGELVHVISDMHIYDRHIPLIKELIAREPYAAPKFEIIRINGFL